MSASRTLSLVPSAGLLLIIALLSGVSFLRGQIWQDELSLWGDAVQNHPGKARLHENLGVAYAKHGLYDKALQEYRIALTINPRFASAHNSLAYYFLDLGRLDEAVKEFEIAVSLNPASYHIAFYILGNYYAERNRIVDAQKAYQSYLIQRPNDANVHNRLGTIYEKLGLRQAALKEYETALSLNPNFIAAYTNLKRIQAAATGLR